jgi:hypothetical protein
MSKKIDIELWGRRLNTAANIISFLGLLLSVVMKVRILMGVTSKKSDKDKDKKKDSENEDAA